MTAEAVIARPHDNQRSPEEAPSVRCVQRPASGVSALILLRCLFDGPRFAFLVHRVTYDCAVITLHIHSDFVLFLLYYIYLIVFTRVL